MQLTGNWNYPTSVRFGAGRIAELPGACRDLGMAKPLLITDRQLADHAITRDALERCKAEGLDCGLFSEVSGNPTGEQVMAGVEVFRLGGHDGVIAFGGGSGVDAAKAVAFMTAQDRSIWDFEDVGDNWTRARTAGLPPVVAVPTTSGTGSEVGRASVITDTGAHIKRIIFHPTMLPARVIADPTLTAGLPAGVTAATGMDALSHNMEAYFAPFYHPLARGIAVEGMRLIRDWLPEAVKNGDNLEARAHMMAASMAGATAFQKGLGGMHALAHSLGGLYGAHHGTLNAVLMPYVLEANRNAIAADAAWLANALGLEPSLDGLITWVLTLREEVGIPKTLAALDIKADEAERVGRMAVVDPSAGGNPIAFTEAQYAYIFECAVAGDWPKAF